MKKNTYVQFENTFFERIINQKRMEMFKLVSKKINMHHWEIKENDNYYYLQIQYKKFRTHDIVQNHLETKIYLKRNFTRLTTICVPLRFL